jgi:hypothetical protein
MATLTAAGETSPMMALPFPRPPAGSQLTGNVSFVAIVPSARVDVGQQQLWQRDLANA